jgi:hypothetical protein
MWRNTSERKNKLADTVKSQIRIRVNQDGMNRQQEHPYRYCTFFPILKVRTYVYFIHVGPIEGLYHETEIRKTRRDLINNKQYATEQILHKSYIIALRGNPLRIFPECNRLSAVFLLVSQRVLTTLCKCHIDQLFIADYHLLFENV